ncbi:MAG: zinc metallopeptidase [Planctomycetaceae bacterium]|nr:zinc metallopeptidase [Planctomycetaceae bacterium]
MLYLLMMAPAILLALWAQGRVQWAYSSASQVPAPLSGAAAARYVLDQAGLNSVGIEQIPGQLTDHYDPSAKVLRLSPEVFRGQSMASVGIAAHEAGHAIQDAVGYAPLVIRNAAVPVANFGGGISTTLLFLGVILQAKFLLMIGIALFSTVVFFQLVNLPVEFDASNRAKRQLVELGIVNRDGMQHVNSVLNAAAWTYVAGTLQSVMTLLYYVMLFSGGRRSDD